MLAYVFWHWPNAEAEPKSYENGLVEFQKALAETGPTGFHRSVVFRVNAPWAGAAQRGYEDWYLVEGSSALDPLNEAAVSGICLEPHNRAARSAAGGTAGLYRLRRGDPKVAQSRWATWLTKLPRTTYDDFYAQLWPWTNRPGVSLWGRQMVLGPTPEFCLLAPDRLELPAVLTGLTIELELIWS